MNGRIRKCLAQKHQVLRAQRHGSEEGHSQADTAWGWGAAGHPAPARILSQQIPCYTPTPSIHVPIYLHSPKLLVCKAKGTRRPSPTQHHSSGSLNLTLLLPQSKKHQGVPGSLLEANPALPPHTHKGRGSFSLPVQRESLVLAGIHTHHSKPRATSVPLDSGLTSHANKTSPH